MSEGFWKRRLLSGLAGLVLGLVGCQSKDGAPAVTLGPPAGPPPIPRSASAGPPDGGRFESRPESRFSATAEGLPTPNAYRVHLDWHAMEKTGVEMWRVQRTGRTTRISFDRTFEGMTDTYDDAAVTAGEAYQYLLSAMRGGAATLQVRADVTVPRDYEIRRTMTLRRITGVNRLFFARGARLVTRGEGLFIDVGELLSEDGIITTYSETESTAPEQAAGRNAESLVIRARSGTGILTIVAAGQRGGRGNEGAPGLPGQPGAPGAPAVAAWRQPWHMTQGMSCANPRPALETLRLAPDPRDVFCRQRATAGGAGTPGSEGGAGGRGMRGGDAPRVYVDIDNATALQVRPEVLAGPGGEGGRGGEGGPGGIGGPPGANDLHGICHPAAPGPQGPRGLRGLVGEPGAAGNAPMYCLRLTRTVFGDCAGYAPWPELVQ